jgi:type IX secretion system PorP/SprF family membrane protein
MKLQESLETNIKMTKKVFLAMLLFVSITFYGQQEPQYTQYMYNTSMINPAYSGSKGNMNLFGLYRAQWVGLDGAPTTANIAMHKPIDGTSLGYGVSVLNDRIGPSDETQFSADLSYTIFFNKNNRLAFGLKVAGSLLNIDYTKLNQYTSGEGILQNNVTNRFSPNIGTGVYYYNQTSYLGLSVPMLLDTKRYDDIANSSVNQRYHVYLMGGKVYDLDYNLKFKPAFVAKAVSGAPLQVDVSGNFMFNEKFTVGLGYRWSASISAMAGFQISKTAFVGYGYDRETTKLSSYNSGSHELFLLFDLFGKTQKVDSPRFF